MTVAFPFDQVTSNATTAPTKTPSQEDSPPAPSSEISNPASTELAEIKSEISNRASTDVNEIGSTELAEIKSEISNFKSEIPKPVSQKRLTANRNNAQKSTGPRTLQGKIASAQNALKHGLRSKIYFENQPKTLHLCPEESNHPTESGETYAIFQQEFKEELQPRTILQKSLFPQIVTLAWRLRRLPHTEQEIFARLATNEVESAPQPEPAQQSLAVSRINTLENPNSETANPPSEISNPKSQIPSPQSAISNPQSTIPSSNSSFPPLPPPCQTLADIFCTATPNNPFTLFNRYERSLQNAYLRLLRQYHYLKKHHPTTPVDHSRPLPPQPAWNPNEKEPIFEDDDLFADTYTNEPTETPEINPKTNPTTSVFPNEATADSSPSPGAPGEGRGEGLPPIVSNEQTPLDAAPPPHTLAPQEATQSKPPAPAPASSTFQADRGTPSQTNLKGIQSMKWCLLLIMLLTPAFTRADDDADTIGLLISVLKDTPDPAAQADMLKGMNAAMEGKRSVKMPAGWSDLYPKLSASPNEEVRKQSAKLSAIFGDAGTLEAMRKTALDTTKPAEERAKALDSLIGKNEATLAPLLQSLLKDPVLAEPALKGLASTDDPKTPAAILAAYPDLSQPAKRAAINTLSFRPAFAKGLMQAVKDNKIPKEDLTAYTVRQLRSFGDKEIDAWTTEIWGVAKTSNEQKLAEIAKYKSLLTPDLLKTGDALAGRALFSKTCMQCHTLFGEGGKVGPDLTGSNRQDIDYLMVNIVDPSAVIAKDYMVSNIYMKDGDAYSGIITKEDEHTLSVTVESGVQVLQKEEVKEIRRSELSMMPEGLLTPLSKTELVNLITYLRSTSQVGEKK